MSYVSTFALGSMALLASVGSIELVYSRLSQPEQRRIRRQRFLARVRKIGEQAEVEMRITIGKEPDFERLDELLNAASVGKHRRNHHQRPRFPCNAGGEIHSRQRVRRHQQSRQPVDRRHG